MVTIQIAVPLLIYLNLNMLPEHFFFFPAEFIIALAEKNNTFEKFKKVLDENGAEFPVVAVLQWQCHFDALVYLFLF